MLTIRLTRVGKKNDPSFRVIVVDSKKKVKTGNYLEMVGSYDPRRDQVELKKDRITHWIKNGASVSDTVHNILINAKVIEGKKINVLPRKSVPTKEEAVGAEASSEVKEEPSPEVAEVAPSVQGDEASGEDNDVAAETPVDTIAE